MMEASGRPVLTCQSVSKIIVPRRQSVKQSPLLRWGLFDGGGGLLQWLLIVHVVLAKEQSLRT